MQPAILIRLRPRGPWRYAAIEGGNDRVDKLFRSDRLYSAVTGAMRQFGIVEEWFEATARAQTPKVVLSSLFPFQGETLFLTPPRTLWPPLPGSVATPSPVFFSKLRLDAAEFVPVSLLDDLLNGRPMLAEQWAPDPESRCLLRRDRPSVSPFRVVTRTRAAVDRLTQEIRRADLLACIEFEPSAGVWCVVRFVDSEAQGEWNQRVRAAFRLLGDSGFGAGRSIGWGQTNEPEIQEGIWPRLLLPRAGRVVSQANGNGTAHSYWLLSLYSPASGDANDWSSGSYGLISRGGRSRKTAHMLAEGSVVVASHDPIGTAVDIGSREHGHEVYRSGFALALRLPEAATEDIQPVEMPTDEEAPEAKPCPTEPPLEPAQGESTAEAPALEREMSAEPESSSTGSESPQENTDEI
jgi:CRISPR type III-A-associated RAMP protein Csm4